MTSTNRNGHFGQIRGILYNPPSIDNWYALHEHLAKVPTEVGIDYCLNHGIESWPAHIRNLRMKQGSPFQNKDGLRVSPFFTPYEVEVESTDEGFIFTGLQCIDADGYAFEAYDKLLVDRDVVRKQDESPRRFTVYQGAQHFEEQNKQLPSSALQCNYLVAALKNLKKTPALEQLLQQYRRDEHTDGWFSWHTANTLAVYDGDIAKIIHYPHDSDFPSYGGKSKINDGKRHVLEFPLVDVSGTQLRTTGLNNTNLDNLFLRRAVAQYTGLGEDPKAILSLARHLRLIPQLWVPRDVTKADTRAAFVGGDSTIFSLYAGGGLYYACAVRWVASLP